MNRNFRANYMSALGLQASTKPLQLLLQEELIDLAQLKSLLSKLVLTNELRSDVWKLLLGVYPVCKESWSFVAKQTEESYGDIKQFSSAVSSLNFESTTQSRAKTILQVYLVYQQRYCQLAMSVSESVLLKMVAVFAKLFELECEAYFCFTKFLNYSAISQMVPRYISVLSTLLEKKEPDLAIAFRQHKVDFYSFASNWFLASFSSLFSERIMIQIWDKIILLGDVYRVVLAFSILQNLKKALISLNGQELKHSLYNLTQIAEEETIFQRSLSNHLSWMTEVSDLLAGT